MQPLRILVDTREQKPLWRPGKNVTKKKLDVGDYTTETLLGHFHIERKSAGDLYGSIIQGHERFRKELLRAVNSNIKLSVAVECTEKDFYGKKWSGGYRCRVKGNVLAKIVATISSRYKVGFVWCDGRVAMRKKVKELLVEEENKQRFINRENI